MSINWIVRVKSKAFWVALIPAILLLVQVIAAVFGYVIDFSELSGKLLAVVDAIFVVLVIIGITVDPTTQGVSDSKLVLTYGEPRTDEKTKVLEQYLKDQKAA